MPMKAHPTGFDQELGGMIGSASLAPLVGFSDLLQQPGRCRFFDR